MIISVIRPVLFSFVTSKRVKRLIVELLEALASNTENTLDDDAVAAIRRAILPSDEN